MVLKKRVIISILMVPFVSYTLLFAEDQKQSNIPLGVWENSVSFSEETLSDYLPEEGSDDIIKARRFNTKYSTDEKNEKPWGINIIGSDRDYETQDADNKSLTFKAGFGKRVPERNNSPFTQNSDLKYRRKRYGKQLTNSFDQLGAKYSLHYLKKKEYKISGAFSFDSFFYTENTVKDYSRYNWKVVLNRFFNKEKVKLQVGFKREKILQDVAGRKKERNEGSALFRWKVEESFLHALKLNGSAGFRDAKDEEGNDKDIDYQFRNGKIRIEHVPSKKIRFFHTAEHRRKDYKIDSRYDHEGYELVQGWKFTPYNTKERIIYINADINYKDFNYTTENRLDFKRSGFRIKSTIRQKGDWKAYAGTEYYKRDQKDNMKDEYTIKLLGGYEKRFLNEFLELGVILEYANRDFDQKGDKQLYKVKLNLNYKI